MKYGEILILLSINDITKFHIAGIKFRLVSYNILAQVWKTYSHH